MNPVIERDKNILNAAVEAFSRFGVKRTSMNDLAEQAGISRQTLYKSYSNKDDVLRALIEHLAQTAIDEIETALVGIRSVDEQLEIVLDIMVLGGFDRVQATPNAQDILDGFNESGRAELERSAERFQEVIERVLEPHDEKLEARNLDTAEMARFIYRSAKAASSSETEREQLVTQLRVLRNICVAAIS